jgi:hypothetical protein
LKALGAIVPEHAPAVAAKVQGVPGLSRAAIGRMAYRVAKGMTVADALKLEQHETSGRGGTLTFQVPDSEADHGETGLARLVRKGLGILMGMTEAQAEMWAETTVTIGRPRKADAK